MDRAPEQQERAVRVDWETRTPGLNQAEQDELEDQGGERVQPGAVERDADGEERQRVHVDWEPHGRRPGLNQAEEEEWEARGGS